MFHRSLTGARCRLDVHERATPAVSADEAKAARHHADRVGAEKAANKDGTIPAYTGGLTTAPAGFKTGDGIRPDPFAAEKPLY